MTRLHALVRGRVQGVGFRAWTVHTAHRLAIPGGRVRNLPGGSVEVEAEAADRMILEGFVRLLHGGPSAAHVDSVEVQWEQNTEPRFVAFRSA